MRCQIAGYFLSAANSAMDVNLQTTLQECFTTSRYGKVLSLGSRSSECRSRQTETSLLLSVCHVWQAAASPPQLCPSRATLYQRQLLILLLDSADTSRTSFPCPSKEPVEIGSSSIEAAKPADLIFLPGKTS